AGPPRASRSRAASIRAGQGTASTTVPYPLPTPLRTWQFALGTTSVARGRAHDREIRGSGAGRPDPDRARPDTLPPNPLEMKRILLIRSMNGAHVHPPGPNGSASIRIPRMYATSRRQFLQRATSAAAFVAMARPDIAARVAGASRAVAGRTPDDIAAD